MVRWSPDDRRWAILGTDVADRQSDRTAESPDGDGRTGVVPPDAGDPVCEECESAGHFEVLDASDGALDDHLA
jgi:hypothetical protein